MDVAVIWKLDIRTANGWLQRRVRSFASARDETNKPEGEKEDDQSASHLSDREEERKADDRRRRKVRLHDLEIGDMQRRECFARCRIVFVSVEGNCVPPQFGDRKDEGRIHAFDRDGDYERQTIWYKALHDLTRRS